MMIGSQGNSVVANLGYSGSAAPLRYVSSLDLITLEMSSHWGLTSDCKGHRKRKVSSSPITCVERASLAASTAANGAQNKYCLSSDKNRSNINRVISSVAH
eukprot:scaffold17448_cov203-Skeletonema_dohrnii-CCMP3373.AAC.4